MTREGFAERELRREDWWLWWMGVRGERVKEGKRKGGMFHCHG